MTEINSEKYREIQDCLKRLEVQEDITIIHAAESGSRAWGFPSKDSDYDIRIIYHHKPEWYISPFDKKDYLEIPITDELDIAGWDLAKTLSLLYKGNAAVHEWLNSPISYYGSEAKFKKIWNFSRTAFNGSPAFYHYISLAKRKFLEDSTRYNAKSYLYGLRALLCATWVCDHNSAPPVLFSPLSNRYLTSELHFELDDVLRTKANQKEKDAYEIPNKLWNFSNEMYQNISGRFTEKKRHDSKIDYEKLLRDLIL